MEGQDLNFTWVDIGRKAAVIHHIHGDLNY